MQRYLLVFILASVALLSILPMPYGFYMLSRVVNAVVFGVLAYRLHASGSQVWIVAIGFLIVYNPIVPIHLGSKPLWTFVNFIGVVFSFIATRIAHSLSAETANGASHERPR